MLMDVPVSLQRKCLSDTNPQWWLTPNLNNVCPEINFACCEPFQVISEKELTKFIDIINKNKSKAVQYSRSFTIRGIPEIDEILGCSNLEMILSKIVGIELKMHPIKVEHSHVNLQAKNEESAVDDWHLDYVPFVFVILLEKSGKETVGVNSGRLCTKDFGDFSMKPGEGILLQGSHVLHKAEMCEEGSRTSLVISLVPKNIELYDCTMVYKHRPTYDEQSIFYDFISYRMANIKEMGQNILSSYHSDENIKFWISRIRDECMIIENCLI
ncbi:hypothetical protein [Zooshikella harenae]|uniref:Fe2OG dioxygenase domain-containing protein n=1 Tax=Zooshikella harenae TaxID=2827238 RepID=A0ABS5ZC64_9GAMM|nr:hypothetical protein [Zooshikella harenae]MBU2711584.1 hypothetical protein [Zooshikella harenae]